MELCIPLPTLNKLEKKNEQKEWLSIKRIRVKEREKTPLCTTIMSSSETMMYIFRFFHSNSSVFSEMVFLTQSTDLDRPIHSY